LKKDKLPIERGVKGKNFLNYGQKQIIFRKKTECSTKRLCWMNYAPALFTNLNMSQKASLILWIFEFNFKKICKCNNNNCDEKCTGQVWLNFFELTIEMVIFFFLHSIANCSKQHMLLAFSFICNIKMQTHNKEKIFFISRINWEMAIKSFSMTKSIKLTWK
jgi:hypothetical protein